jgi:hypothetical protein
MSQNRVGRVAAGIAFEQGYWMAMIIRSPLGESLDYIADLLAATTAGTPIQYNYAGLDAPFQTIVVIEQLL